MLLLTACALVLSCARAACYHSTRHYGRGKNYEEDAAILDTIADLDLSYKLSSIELCERTTLTPTKAEPLKEGKILAGMRLSISNDWGLTETVLNDFRTLPEEGRICTVTNTIGRQVSKVLL